MKPSRHRARRASLPAIPVLNTNSQKKKPLWMQSMLNLGRRFRLSDPNVCTIFLHNPDIVFVLLCESLQMKST